MSELVFPFSMRAVIQRVSKASVSVGGQTVGKISQGLCCLIGIETIDTETNIDYIVKKITSLKVFEQDGKMWKANVGDIKGGILCISQFTLYARTRKGATPDFSKAMKSAESFAMWIIFMEKLRASYTGEVAEGQFGAMMDVDINNDGPVTISIDSKDTK
jgi:D-aminoacyl-tRNA deacylase